MKKLMCLITIIIILWQTASDAQMDGLHGDDAESRMGVHSGNQFRTSFFNDGTFGGRPNHPPQVAGEWPIGSGHYYLVDGNIFIGSEVTDAQNNTYPIISENKSMDIGGSRGDKCGADQHWCTFLPLPGFANPNNDKIAMSKWPDSWPSYWPDIADPNNERFSPDGWAGAWNGYFGKNIFNADEESYFIADDYENKEFYPYFIPDTTNLDRGGLGIRMYVRNFQWSFRDVDDVFFTVFDFENIGTYTHHKMVSAYKIGNTMGEDNVGADAGDDEADFNRDLNLVYLYDQDDFGAGNWTPVGYMGATFLESPGIANDGIDNDNDGVDYSGPVIDCTMFESKILSADAQIVIINYNTYERTLTTLEDLGGSYEFTFNHREYSYHIGDTVQEIGDNLIDDNLNGLIDENRGCDNGLGTVIYLYEGYKCIDYFSGSGADNPLIDERRDDGIDNNGNWNPEFDDTGVDGLLPKHPNYPGPDAGENDGIPTIGEPHFDLTDINESDMIGLSSFNLYNWSTLCQYDDESYWNAIRPGLFTVDQTTSFVELLFGSGYFSMVPRQRQRISLGILLAYELSELINIKNTAQLAYSDNYKLPNKPKLPVVTASVYDKKVTLSWDDSAEKSYDRILGCDFEGYRIYKIKYPEESLGEPIAQFDLDNEYVGYSSIPVNGSYFWLGNNTGLKHSLVDTVAEYGFDYYYIVTSYDHGDVDREIPPMECMVGLSIGDDGNIRVSNNVVAVRPVSPDAYKYDAPVRLIKGLCDGKIACDIVETGQVCSNHTYQITFEDTLNDDRLDITKNFTLTDMTDNEVIIDREPFIVNPDNPTIVDGFRLSFLNAGRGILEVNSDSSGWNHPGIPVYNFARYNPTPSTRPIKLISADFEIRFSDIGVDTSSLYYRGTSNIPIPAIPVNFTVINTTTNEPVDFAFRERHVKSEADSGRFSFDFRMRRSDEIILLANSDPDSLVASWYLNCIIYSAIQSDSLTPGPGDILTLKLNKPFLSHDVFEFTMPEIQPFGIQDNKSTRPVTFSLSQNYPNPFNPSTKIEYVLPKTSDVQIVIFDITGRAVEQLIKKTQQPGYYTIVWDASQYSSGVYFYRIVADNFNHVKKMVLMK